MWEVKHQAIIALVCESINCKYAQGVVKVTNQKDIYFTYLKYTMIRLGIRALLKANWRLAKFWIESILTWIVSSVKCEYSIIYYNKMCE